MLENNVGASHSNFRFLCCRSGALGVSPLLVRTWGAASAPCDAASPISGVVRRRAMQQLRMRCRNTCSYSLRRVKASNAFPDLNVPLRRSAHSTLFLKLRLSTSEISLSPNSLRTIAVFYNELASFFPLSLFAWGMESGSMCYLLFLSWLARLGSLGSLGSMKWRCAPSSFSRDPFTQ